MHSNIAGAIRIPESCYFAGRKSDSVDDSTLNLPTWGLNEGSDPERPLAALSHWFMICDSCEAGGLAREAKLLSNVAT